MSEYYSFVSIGLFALCSANLLAGKISGDKSDTGVKQVKLLAIGNSFSVNATTYLRDIVKAAGNPSLAEDPVRHLGNCELVFAQAAKGGLRLEQLWNFVAKHEQDPDSDEGRPFSLNGQKAGLRDMLAGDKWQYVTLQQYSWISGNTNSYYPYITNLYAYIKKHAPQAEIVIHETWAYRSDNDIFKDGYTSAKMYQQVATAYYTIAKELGGCRVIPVGDAFQLASESPEFEFKRDPNFDYKNPRYPDLPKELHSLHAGCRWNVEGDAKKIAVDYRHASVAGQFLGACVWFEFFFGEDVRKNTYRPVSLSEKDAAFLRDIAHKVVSEGVKPKAWPAGVKHE